jgi:hypothetical protein
MSIPDIDDLYHRGKLHDKCVHIDEDMYEKYGVVSDSNCLDIKYFDELCIIIYPSGTIVLIPGCYHIVDLSKFMPILIQLGTDSFFIIHFYRGHYHENDTLCDEIMTAMFENDNVYLKQINFTTWYLKIIYKIRDLYLSGFSTMTYIKQNMSAIITDKQKKLTDITIKIDLF